MRTRLVRRLPDLFIITLLLVTLWRMVGVTADPFATKLVAAPKLLTPGDVLVLNTQHSERREVILFALTTCPACEANVPVYQQLGSHIKSGQSSLRFLVVSTEPKQVVSGWLSAAHITFNEIVQIGEFDEFGIVVTPTLVIRSSDRRVTDVYMGLVPEDSAEALFTRIYGGPQSVPLNNVPRELSSQMCDDLARSGRVTMIDVRERSEYAVEHHPHAINIPMVELTARAPIEVPVEGTVMIAREVPLDRRRLAGLSLLERNYSDVVLCGDVARRVKRW